jgi:hypothetical protein
MPRLCGAFDRVVVNGYTMLILVSLQSMLAEERQQVHYGRNRHEFQKWDSRYDGTSRKGAHSPQRRRAQTIAFTRRREGAKTRMYTDYLAEAWLLGGTMSLFASSRLRVTSLLHSSAPLR